MALVAQTVKNLPTMWEIWVQSLGWEDPLEEGMATHSSILAWRIPMDRGAWQATVHRIAEQECPVLSLYHRMLQYFHLISSCKQTSATTIWMRLWKIFQLDVLLFSLFEPV